MNSTDCHQRIGKLRANVHSHLNNTHIWSSIAIQALKYNISDKSLIEKGKFVIPSTNGKSKAVIRNTEDITSIMSKAIKSDIYKSIFITNIAEMEAFLSDLVYTILHFEPRRILTSVPAKDIVRIKEISLEEFITCSNQQELLAKIIDRQVANLLYAKPYSQFIYLEKILDIKIEVDLQSKWFEIKATRDLLVHNSCIINKIYLEKAGKFARGRVGEAIEVDKDYFEESLVVMKSLSGKMSSRLQAWVKSKDNSVAKENNK